MKKLILPLASAMFFSCASSDPVQQWPSAGGPNSSYEVTDTKHDAPKNFSVSDGTNIKWTMDLPEAGQSGIAIHGNKAFLTIIEPVTKENYVKTGSNIRGLCIDLSSRKILWQCKLTGKVKANYLYGFSDSTTPTPVTDGKNVWFFNASGQIACYTTKGEKVWERNWDPIEKLDGVKFPFNKQYEPIISGNLIINVEPYYEKDGERTYGWNYLFAFNKLTGEKVWVSEGALTHYNTPFLSKTAEGKDAILIGRGGHHRVPEAPRGYSMIDAQTGKSIWEYEADAGMCLYQSSWNDKYAIWMTYDGIIHLLDSKTGKLIKKISITENVDAEIYDKKQRKLIQHKDFNITKSVGITIFPAWFSTMLIDDKLYFMCFGPERYGPVKKAGPINAFARVDLKTNKVEYVQFPTSLVDNKKTWLENIPASTINNRDLDIAGDKRSKRDGWSWVFNGNPICVNNKIYYTLQNGRVYVIDAKAEKFDQTALLSISDLGEAGQTWSLNTPSFANGKLYHRTLKQLICIEEDKK
ncbi:PQQ-binding-like beta-propeller repeat protein [Lentisphaera profundi]|uniref:PQQ-binding-like beta-propeller repeat protein n=1 Tax=Lentisphaera profundi TaxID=1658616 RepID=A0ABY7VSM8_9BACT|nr:PQQ-binding-like beta-propeller repeat protein [Lentisphaera profundi]WDE97052.1 PQQ-binding-like beta-propeller repeat protein [Lentisphaera profundi]